MPETDRMMKRLTIRNSDGWECWGNEVKEVK